MKRVYVATTQLAFDQAKAADRVPVYLMSARERIEADEFVFYGPGAKEAMAEFRASGISEHELSWFDDKSGQIRDFHWDKRRSMDELPRTVPQRYLPCGVSGLSKVVNWRLPELVIVAGPYGSGKSLFAQILAQDFARQNGVPVVLTCWEDRNDEMRDAFVRYRDTAANFKTEDARAGFLKLVRTTIVENDRKRDLDQHFQDMYTENKRFGTKFFVLDPWNAFRHIKNIKQSDADYVINVLSRAQEVVEDLQIIMVITTHVAAEYFDAKGDIRPFKIGNAFGTSQFGNFAHRGFCVMRTDTFTGEQQMLVRQDKVKEEDRMGRDSDGNSIVLSRRMGQRDTMVFSYSSRNNALYWDKETSLSDRVTKIWRG